MLKRPLFLLTCAVLIAAGFCLGIARLFALRYQSGEVYPPYSTLRADPLGAKAIYAALDGLPGVEVRRNFLPLKKLQPGRPITLVYAGVGHQSYWTERELQELESLLANGSRVVFAFFPFDRPPLPSEIRREQETERERKAERLEKEEKKPADNEAKTTPEPAGDDGKKEKKKPEDFDRSGLLSFQKVAKGFGFQFDFLPAEEGKTYKRQAFAFEPGAKLERDVSWHSALCFTELSPEWKALYLSETKPVVVERSYGRGSIVLASDSFFLSNEAMRKERHAGLLSRVFSGPSPVVFDEEHLGVTDQPGVAQLALKYRLHGVIAGLVLVAGLFVWKNAVRFLPAFPEGGRDVVTGKDAAQGFSNLLRRSIEPADLLAVCVEEWRRGGIHSDPEIAEVEELVAQEEMRPPKQRDPVAAYREIARALARQ